MGDLASQIHWGTGFENTLDFDFPQLIDNVRFWRQPGPGAARSRNAAGTTDVAIYGYDYMMAGRARWFGAAAYSNPVGLQAFFDWAGRGNTFRFLPDKNVQDFYVDGVTLEQPFETPEPGLEDADGSQSIDMVLRNPTVDFGQAMRGIMFEYVPGASLVDPVAASFTRATAAARRGLPGSLLTAIGATELTNALRDRHYEGALRTALFEAQRTQLITQPDDFSAWASIGGSPVLTGVQADPFGGTDGWLIEDDSAASDEGKAWTIPGGTFVGDGTKAGAIFIKAGTATVSMVLWWRDLTAGGTPTLLQLTATWTAGVPVVAVASGSGTVYAVEPWGNGWYRVLFAVNSVLAANNNEWRVMGAMSGNTPVGSTRYFRANMWNDQYPSSPQGPTLLTRNADVFSRSFPYAFQGVFGYTKYVEVGQRLGAVSRGLMRLGSGSPNTRLLTFYEGTASFPRTLFDNGVGGQTRSPSGTITSPAQGDVVEVLSLLYSDGSVAQEVSYNGGAPIVSARSAANPSTTPRFAGDIIYIGEVVPSGSVPLALTRYGALTFGGVTRDTLAKVRVA